MSLSFDAVAPVALLAVVTVTMIAEARLSARNTRALLARGAVEPAGDVYRAMAVVYPACFVGIVGEGLMRGSAPPWLIAAGGAIFVAGKAIKYAAIAALGGRWSFRVLVLPGAPLVITGPYRWLRHPNYLGVVAELIGAGLIAGAPVAGTISLVGFGALLSRRVQIEEAVLAGARTLPSSSPAGRPGSQS